MLLANVTYHLLFMCESILPRVATARFSQGDQVELFIRASDVTWSRVVPPSTAREELLRFGASPHRDLYDPLVVISPEASRVVYADQFNGLYVTPTETREVGGDQWNQAIAFDASGRPTQAIVRRNEAGDAELVLSRTSSDTELFDQKQVLRAIPADSYDHVFRLVLIVDANDVAFVMYEGDIIAVTPDGEVSSWQVSRDDPYPVGAAIDDDGTVVLWLREGGRLSRYSGGVDSFQSAKSQLYVGDQFVSAGPRTVVTADPSVNELAAIEFDEVNGFSKRQISSRFSDSMTLLDARGSPPSVLVSNWAADHEQYISLYWRRDERYERLDLGKTGEVFYADCYGCAALHGRALAPLLVLAALLRLRKVRGRDTG